jgi:hypothetical protein
VKLSESLNELKKNNDSLKNELYLEKQEKEFMKDAAIAA